MAVQRRRRRSEEDEEETRPRRRRSAPDPDEYAGADEEPDEVEDDDEEEEDERPRGRRSAKASRRRSRDEDDEDDEDDDEFDPGTVSSGWKGWKSNKSKTSSYPDRFTPDKEEALIKFLEDEPFVTYNQHWIERPGKKSFVCLGNDCPLCDIGDKPTAYAVFNILDLSEKNPTVKTWEARPRLASQIEEKASSERTGPLTKMYYAVSRTGKGGKSTTKLDPIKERDLEDDWGIEPLSKSDLAKYRKDCWDASSVSRTQRSEMRKIAREVTEDDD